MNETKRINSSEAAAVDRMLDISSEQRDYSFSLDELKEVAVPQSKKRKKLSDVIKTEAAAVKWLKSMRLEEWDSCRLDELKALIQKFPMLYVYKTKMALYCCIVLAHMAVTMKSFNF